MTRTRNPTTLEYALLAVVSLGKSSAYDIRCLFTDTPMGQFSSSPGSIYPALERLEQRRLLSSIFEPGRRGSERRMYSLTATGGRVLNDWLRSPPTEEEVRRRLDTIMLRFSFIENRLSKDEALDFLRRLRPLLESYRNELQSYVDRFNAMPALHAELGARHGVMSYDAHLAWVDEAQERLGE